MNPLIAALLAAGVISAEEARTLNGLLNEGATRIEAEQRVAAAFANGFENQRSRLIRALDAGNVDYRDPMLPTFWAAEHDLLAREVLPTLTGIAQDVALTATVRSGGLADWRTVNEAVIAWTDSHYRSVAGDALGSIPNLDNTARDAVADAVNRWQRGELNAGPGPGGLPRLIAELQNVEAFGVDRAARIAVTETTRIFAESERTAAQANPNMVYLVWQTGNDEFVCPICAPMEGQRIPKGQPTFPGGYYPPAHPNCRCGVTAVTEVAAEVMSGARAYSDVAAGRGETVRAAQGVPSFASVADARTYATDVLGVRNVNFEGLTVEQANAITGGISRTRAAYSGPATTSRLHNIEIDSEMTAAARYTGQGFKVNPKLLNMESIAPEVSISNLNRRIANLTAQIEDNKEWWTAADIAKVQERISDLHAQVHTASIPWGAPKTIDDVIVHELGHGIQADLRQTQTTWGSPSVLRNAGIDYKNGWDVRLQTISQTEGLRISQYAATEGDEYFAEAWVRFVSGDHDAINPDLLSVFKEIAK